MKPVWGQVRPDTGTCKIEVSIEPQNIEVIQFMNVLLSGRNEISLLHILRHPQHLTVMTCWSTDTWPYMGVCIPHPYRVSELQDHLSPYPFIQVWLQWLAAVHLRSQNSFMKSILALPRFQFDVSCMQFDMVAGMTLDWFDHQGVHWDPALGSLTNSSLESAKCQLF